MLIQDWMKLLSDPLKSSGVDMLACADWCNDNGKPTEEKALRWMAKSAKRPVKADDRPKARRHIWMRGYWRARRADFRQDLNQESTMRLPASLFLALPESSGSTFKYKTYGSFHQAVFALGKGLETLEEMLAGRFKL